MNAFDHEVQQAEAISVGSLPHSAMPRDRDSALRKSGVVAVGCKHEHGQSNPASRRSTSHSRQKRFAVVPTIVPVNTAAAGKSADTTTSHPRVKVSVKSPSCPMWSVTPSCNARSDAPIDVPSG
eukprot:4173573-Prymnesium_polylepis.1